MLIVAEFSFVLLCDKLLLLCWIKLCVSKTYQRVMRIKSFGILKMLVLCLCLSFSFGVEAQRRTFRHLDMSDGLSNNYVSDFAQDKEGRIWIATEGGLSVFDGHSFNRYNRYTTGMSGDGLNTIFYDSRDGGTLWIGAKNGLSKMNCTDRTFKEVKIDGLYNVMDIEMAADSGLWFVNHYNDIVHYDVKSGKVEMFNEKRIKGLGYSFRTIYDAGNGTVYVGYANDGFGIVDLKKGSVRRYRNVADDDSSLPGNNVYRIFVDRYNRIWLATNRGLALYNRNSDDFTVFRHIEGDDKSLIADHVYDIKEMEDGKLWVCTDAGGISILDLSGLSFQNSKRVEFENILPTYDNTGLWSPSVRHIFSDSFGNIWIGTNGDGIDFIGHSQPIFSVLPYEGLMGRRIRPKSVWGLCADEDGGIWLGGKNELVKMNYGKIVERIELNGSVNQPIVQVQSIFIDKEKNIYIGLFDNGVLKYNNDSGSLQRIKLGSNNEDIACFYQESNGQILVGAENGVYVYDGEEAKPLDFVNKTINGVSVTGLLRDKQGKLWVATYGSGVFVFGNRNKFLKRICDSDGLFSEAINNMIIDKTGRIWFAMREGIAKIQDSSNPSKIVVYGHGDGMKDCYARAIATDDKGNLWISTNSCIMMLDDDSGKFYCYDIHDGVPESTFMDASVTTLKDGTICFGSFSGGVCCFRPSDVMKDSVAVPNVIIMSVKLLNQNLIDGTDEIFIPVDGDKVTLNHNENSFRIEFAVPDFSLDGIVDYSYYIEGLSEGWVDIHGENYITLRDVSPGKYVVKIRARLRNGEWDESNVVELRLEIQPPIWASWYAYVFYVVLLLLIGWWLLWSYKHKLFLEGTLTLERERNKNAVELNDERLRFYTNITHELRTPLTLILGPLDDLVADKELPKGVMKKITVIRSSAMRLLNLVNQLLEFRKTETQNRHLTVVRDNLSNLVKEIGLRFKELNTNSDVNISIDVEDNIIVFFDVECITTIINNLLSNALKYTQKGSVYLRMKLEHNGRNTVVIEVGDTGCGISEDELPHIFERYYQANGKRLVSGSGIGLALVKSLASVHNATIDVYSKENYGSVFTLRLNADENYPEALHRGGDEEVEMADGTDKDEAIEELDSLNNETDVLPSVLVVEDNDDIREYVSTSFPDDYRIITAKDGLEGLNLAFKEIPDIIISDIMMPVMDGIALCKKIKEDMRTSHIPVILLTAKDSLRDKEVGYDSGADSYLTKPFSAKLLISRVNNLLENRRKLASLIAKGTSVVRFEKVTGEMEANASNNEVVLSKLDSLFMEKLNGLINENIDDAKLDIAFMTDRMNMSHSTFYRKVKALTGVSANEYIRKVRLHKSAEILCGGVHNVTEAAYMTGFNNLGYFRECFKSEYGMSPSQYAEKYRG